RGAAATAGIGARAGAAIEEVAATVGDATALGAERGARLRGALGAAAPVCDATAAAGLAARARVAIRRKTAATVAPLAALDGTIRELVAVTRLRCARRDCASALCRAGRLHASAAAAVVRRGARSSVGDARRRALIIVALRV